MRYYKHIKYPTIPPSIYDVYIITTVGDRLDLLASQFYNDIKLWWVIAIANKGILRTDSYAVKGGLEIRIPQNIQRIIQNFITLNK